MASDGFSLADLTFERPSLRSQNGLRTPRNALSGRAAVPVGRHQRPPSAQFGL